MNLTFEKLCKGHGIPFELHNLYYQWIINLRTKEGMMRFNQTDLPRGRGKYLRTGLLIPRPYGEEWRQTVYQNGIVRGRNKMNIIQNNQCIMKAAAEPRILAHYAKKNRTKAACCSLSEIRFTWVATGLF